MGFQGSDLSHEGKWPHRTISLTPLTHTPSPSLSLIYYLTAKGAAQGFAVLDESSVTEGTCSPANFYLSNSENSEIDVYL